MPIAPKKLTIRDMEQWFVLRVKWRREQLVSEALEGMGVPCYVAQRYELTTDRRTGKQTRRLKPIIPEIMFARASHTALQTFINETAPRIGATVYFATHMKEGHRTIMVVPDAQMESFMTIASQSEEEVRFLRPEEVSLCEGDEVIIHGGPFDGVSGTLQKVKGIRSKRVVVSIDGLLSAVTAHIEPEYIEVVGRAKGGGLRASAVKDLIVASEVALISKAEGSFGAPEMRALRITASAVTERVGEKTKRSPSLALALLTYALAIGDADMAERERAACMEALPGVKSLQLKEKIEDRCAEAALSYGMAEKVDATAG